MKNHIVLEQQVFNVLIIGAGKIGAFFDNPDQNEVLTHAHAFSLIEGFNLLGLVDVDLVSAAKAAERWHCNFFKTVEEAFEKYTIDVVVVATPDHIRYQILEKIVRHSLKFVLIEKPIATSLLEAKKIKRLFEGSSIQVGVNYTRRFIPAFQQCKEEVSLGLYGKYLTGSGYYGKGLIHNGSHLVDLLRFLIGEIKGISVLNSCYDFYQSDPTVTGIVKFTNAESFFLQGVDCKLYTVFELDLFFEKARVRFTDLGFRVERWKIEANNLFSGYKNIKFVEQNKTDLERSAYYGALAIYQTLAYQKKFPCTLEDGIRALGLCLLGSVKNEEENLNVCP